MRNDELEVPYGWSCMGKVLPEILGISAFWVGVAFLPQSTRATGINLAWLATLLLSGMACWKAGFMSIALVMMGILAMAFGEGYGYVFFAMAGLAGVGTAISVHIRRRRARARYAELQARDRLRRLREDELSLGASMRLGQPFARAPGVLGSRSSVSAPRFSGGQEAAQAPSAPSAGYATPCGDAAVGAPFLSGACASPAASSFSCDPSSDGGGSCGGGD